MGISQFVFQEYEADDIIGTLTRKFEDDTRVTIWTKDQDSLQLINENVRVWLITSKCSEMYEQFGINIKQLNIPKECLSIHHFILNIFMVYRQFKL